MAWSLFVLTALQGVAAAAAAGTVFPDADDTTCVPMQRCSPGIGLVMRGLCVSAAVASPPPAAAATVNQCWDVCNEEKHPLVNSYADAVYAAGIGLMVKEFRTGNKGINSCPGATFAETCNPGERCTPPQNTWGRGMCIGETVNKVTKNHCLDMCDRKIPLDRFHDAAGKQAGTIALVEQVRQGRDPQGLTECPGPSVWTWLWFPLLLCCCLGVCAAAYAAFQYYNSRLKRFNNKNSEPMYEDEEPQYNEPPPVYAEQPAYEEPMPVVEPMPVAEPVTYAAPDQDINTPLFGEPRLMPLQPTTTSAYTTGYAQPYPAMTTGYPQQATRTVYSGAPATTSMYNQQTVMQPATTSMYGGSVTQAQPAYGAYGQYAATSMRIG